MLNQNNHVMKKWIGIMLLLTMVACNKENKNSGEIDQLLSKYTSFTLTSDVNNLTPNERKMIPLLIEAAQEMDKVFWKQAYGDKNELLSKLDEKTRKFAVINYGPWDRLDGNTSFVEGIGEKPVGANFYPKNMTKEEFEAWDSEDKRVCTP